MARCNDCIHEKVCLHRVNIQTDTYAYMGYRYDIEKCEHFKPTADVAPKSEVAREIFMHVDCITHRYLNDRNYSVGEMLYDLDELKKKYTNN